jgi:Tfp pilus assembly protein PilF
MPRDLTIERQRLFARVLRLVRRGALRDAAAAVERHLAWAPDDDRAALKLAEIHRAAGDRASAVEAFVRTGELHARRGFRLRAMAVLKQALPLDRSHRGVLAALADHARHLGFIRDALRHLVALADAAAGDGDPAGELKALREARQLDREDPGVALRMARALAGADDVGAARAVLEETAARCAAAGRIGDWLALGDQLVRLGRRDRPFLLLLARGHLAAADPRGALRPLRASLERDRNDAEAVGLAAEAFRALGAVAKVAAAEQELARIRALGAAAPEPTGPAAPGGPAEAGVAPGLRGVPAPDGGTLVEPDPEDPTGVSAVLARLRAGVVTLATGAAGHGGPEREASHPEPRAPA